MLAAYYGKDYDSAALFDGLEISHCETFSIHLNKYNVFKVNMQEFLSMTQNVDEMLKVLQKRLIKELKYNYPEYVDCDNLVFAMQDIFSLLLVSVNIMVSPVDISERFSSNSRISIVFVCSFIFTKESCHMSISCVIAYLHTSDSFYPF